MVKTLKKLLLPFYIFYRKHKGIYLLKRALRKGSIKIVIGAGGFFEKGWIETEIYFLNLLKESDWMRFFSNKKIDLILAEHVWEHLSQEEANIAATNCYKYLKKRGRLRIAVPDGNHSNKDYIEKVKPGGYGDGSNDHKVLYTIASLSEVFEKVGFRVMGLEYFDSEHNFIQNDWSPLFGKIYRSKRFDTRNSGPELNYTSIIIDAIKE